MQSLLRMRLGAVRVAAVRLKNKQRMEAAATHIRKMYLGWTVRKAYHETREKFTENQMHVIVMQKYTRGFLVRMGMYRSAIQAESEQWASLEIQRVYRGYRGRIRWEVCYELHWMRQVSALKIQTCARRWVGRLRVEAVRARQLQERLAKERRLFKAAQTIQRHARGML